MEKYQEICDALNALVDATENHRMRCDDSIASTLLQNFLFKRIRDGKMATPAAIYNYMAKHGYEE